MTEQVQPITVEEWTMSGNQRNVQANLAANEHVLLGCEQELCAELYVTAEFGPDGKNFSFEVSRYWATQLPEGVGTIRLKVGDDFDEQLTDVAITDGREHAVQGTGIVPTPFGKAEMTFTFIFNAPDKTVTMEAKKTLTHPLS
ncbi:hypothetical protein [Pseudomonas sp. B26(2017)]|uniref:hypothetical protein n=1 Tax=Pseudomonas sp. B26(2017) TaxID=1981732 RepID=UPI00111C02E9|nr:hypothetical protein [Pseudomonas sp. B26(2017)]